MNSLSDDLLKSHGSSLFLDEGVSTSFSNNNLISKSEDIENISFFPRSIRFGPFFPFTQTTKKVIITNSSQFDHSIMLSLTNSSEFSLQPSTLVVKSGESSVVLVTFQPKNAGHFNSKIKCQNIGNFEIPVYGICDDPPILIPDQSDSCWTFKYPAKIRNSFTITNRHYSENCKFIISSNSSAFKLSTNLIEVPPSSKSDISIEYDKRYEIDKDPEITIVCHNFGFNVSRYLYISTSKATMTLNFGTVATNTTFYKELKIQSKDVKNLLLDSPFSASFVSNIFIISFNPSSPGEYSQTVELSDVTLIITGKSQDSAVYYDKKHNIISNKTNKTIQIQMKSLTKEIKLQKNVLELPPKASSRIDMTIDSNRIDKAILAVKCEKIKELLTIDLINLRKRTEIEELASEITITPKMLIFSLKEQNSFPIQIKSNGNFTVKGPKWLDFPNQIDPSSEFIVNCSRIPSDISFSRIIAIGAETKEIPVIAYRGSSNAVCNDSFELVYSGKNKYLSKVEVFNDGDRNMFAVITAVNDNSSLDIQISQPALIIEPNSSKIFTLIVSSDLSEETIIPIVLYTGDEVIRQIYALLNPDSFFAQVFTDFRSEIDNVQKRILNLDRKLFNKQFKDLVFVNKISLVAKKASKVTEIIASPTTLTMNAHSPGVITLINTTSHKIYFETKYQDEIYLSNDDGYIEGYGEFKITVTSKKIMNSSIDIILQTGIINIPVVYGIESVIKPTTFIVSTSVVDFGVCKLKNSKTTEIQVSNLTGRKLQLSLKCIKKSHVKESVFEFIRHVSINPLSICELVLEFSPSFCAQFEESVEIVNEDARESFVLQLVGNGTK